MHCEKSVHIRGFLVGIFSYSDWMCSVWMQEQIKQENYEDEHFFRNSGWLSSRKMSKSLLENTV